MQLSGAILQPYLGLAQTEQQDADDTDDGKAHVVKKAVASVHTWLAVWIRQNTRHKDAFHHPSTSVEKTKKKKKKCAE